MDDVVEEEDWLQQVDEVYDKLSVQHPGGDGGGLPYETDGGARRLP